MTGDSNSIEYGELRLNSKPSAALRYSYIPSDSATTSTLILFINGLLLPQTGWEPTMKLLVQSYHEADKTRPALLAYDRFGQGKSDPDPADEGREDGNTHDLNDVVHNLYEFLEQFYKEKGISISPSQANSLQLMFVCNSIGCPIARLFAQEHPATVSAFLFLDSMMTDTDFVSLFPNPDVADFDQDSLPSGIIVDDVRKARQVYGQFFHPTVLNREGLDRSNVSQLLPYSYTPKLAGPRGWGPLLTVVGHDWDFFAAENKKSFALPEAICHEYVNPQWHQYNQGLAKLTEEQHSKGPIIARDCGHFIQRDNPDFVATQISLLIQRLDDPNICFDQ